MRRKTPIRTDNDKAEQTRLRILGAAIREFSEHGLAALARVLFNSNEFLYVD